MLLFTYLQLRLPYILTIVVKLSMIFLSKINIDRIWYHFSDFYLFMRIKFDSGLYSGDLITVLRVT
ncbi:hypothetical protein BpHYR1_033655 [Brachionus plicatilis]|uniref:Uncharacterized protein n=1 Tax=Brachionus plicatilis TaxID=10195 RepID=A0A3M7PZ39_BRAPC|nr:hypothetical protein BpHYR1_033655 [Brachionus plicatilis]